MSSPFLNDSVRYKYYNINNNTEIKRFSTFPPIYKKDTGKHISQKLNLDAFSHVRSSSRLSSMSFTFLIYTNDLPLSLTNTCADICADDTTVCGSDYRYH